MQRVWRCVSPKSYPHSAYPLFWSGFAFWFLAGLGVRVRDFAYTSYWWLPFGRDILIAAAAISNGFSLKFQTAQRIWAGRTHWLVLLSAIPAVVFFIGSIANGVEADWHSCWESWVMALLFWPAIAGLCHGLVVHVFTCPHDPTPTPEHLRSPAILRVLAWAGFLGAWFGEVAYDYGGWGRTSAGTLMTISLAVFVLAHVLGAASLHFRQALPADTDQQGKPCKGFPFDVKVRGVALIAFWIGAFLMWLAVNSIPLEAESWRLSSLGLAGLVLVLVGGGLTLLLPHPSIREEESNPDEEEADFVDDEDDLLPSHDKAAGWICLPTTRWGVVC